MIDLTRKILNDTVYKNCSTPFNSITRTLSHSLGNIRQQLDTLSALIDSAKIYHGTHCETLVTGIGSAVAAVFQSLMLLEIKLKQNEGQMKSQNNSEFGHKQIVMSVLVSRCKRIQYNFKIVKQRHMERQAQTQKLVKIQLPKTLYSQMGKETDRSTALLMKYQQRDESIKQAQMQLERIEELLTEFGNELAGQESTTEQILEQAEFSLQRIKEGNEQLREAESARNYGKGWAIMFFVMGLSLLLLDILK